MDYQETEDEFILPMLRKNSELYKEQSKFMDPGVVLTYPKNYNFIHKLPKPFIKILVNHGWKTEKTIFLEIPYVVTFTKNFDPSLVQVWPICVPTKKSVFRIVAFTKNYITTSQSIELEDTIIHEQIHIQEDEPKLLKGNSLTMDYEKNEDRVQQQVKEKLLKKYGTDVYDADIVAGFTAFDMQRKLKTICSGTLEYWIQRYFDEQFEKYSDFAIQMNEKLENQGYLEDIEYVSNNATRVYQETFNFKLKPLY